MKQKILKKFTLFFFSIFLLSTFAFAEKISDLKATDYVNDFAGVLTTEQVQELSKTLGDLEKAKGYQIAVAIVKSMDGDYIEHYAVKLYEQWGISTKEKQEGVLFLVAIEDREMRIEVGYGLEPVITDSVAKYILDNDVRPSFKNENYYEGVKKGIDDMVSVLNGGVMPVDTNNDSDGVDWFTIFIVAFIFGINVLGWLFAIMARTKSWWLGGLATFVLGAPILYFLGFTVLSNALLFIFTLTGFIFDYFISKNYKYWQQKMPFDSTGHKTNPAYRYCSCESLHQS